MFDYYTVVLLATAGIAIYYYLQFRELMKINRDLAEFLGLVISQLPKKDSKDAPF